jgi:hypothetical protein
MFVVTEADAAAIRAAFEQRGEFAAAVELRRRFPGITDNAQARECARSSPPTSPDSRSRPIRACAACATTSCDADPAMLLAYDRRDRTDFMVTSRDNPQPW